MIWQLFRQAAYIVIHLIIKWSNLECLLVDLV
jgi:hypothetical protein